MWKWPSILTEPTFKERLARATQNAVFAFHVPGPDLLFVYLDLDETPHVLIRRAGSLHNRLALQHEHAPQLRELWRTLDLGEVQRVRGAPSFQLPAQGTPHVAGRAAYIVELGTLRAAFPDWVSVDPEAVHQALVSASALEGVADWLAMVNAHDGRSCLLEHAAAWARRSDPGVAPPPREPRETSAAEDALAKVVMATERDCADTLRACVRASGARGPEDLVAASQALVRTARSAPDASGVIVDTETWRVFAAALDRLVAPMPGPAEQLPGDPVLTTSLTRFDEEEDGEVV